METITEKTTVKDKPQKIKLVESQESSQMQFKVEWKKRKGGVQPEATLFSKEEMKRYDKDLLL